MLYRLIFQPFLVPIQTEGERGSILPWSKNVGIGRIACANEIKFPMLGGPP